MLDEELNKARLSDRILFALQLAIEQEDLTIAEQLCGALDMAMTRSTGGGEFIERRNFPKEIEHALVELRKIKG